MIFKATLITATLLFAAVGCSNGGGASDPTPTPFKSYTVASESKSCLVGVEADTNTVSISWGATRQPIVVGMNYPPYHHNPMGGSESYPDPTNPRIVHVPLSEVEQAAWAVAQKWLVKGDTLQSVEGGFVVSSVTLATSESGVRYTAVLEAPAEFPCALENLLPHKDQSLEFKRIKAPVDLSQIDPMTLTVNFVTLTSGAELSTRFASKFETLGKRMPAEACKTVNRVTLDIRTASLADIRKAMVPEPNSENPHVSFLFLATEGVTIGDQQGFALGFDPALATWLPDQAGSYTTWDELIQEVSHDLTGQALLVLGGAESTGIVQSISHRNLTNVAAIMAKGDKGTDKACPGSGMMGCVLDILATPADSDITGQGVVTFQGLKDRIDCAAQSCTTPKGHQNHFGLNPSLQLMRYR